MNGFFVFNPIFLGNRRSDSGLNDCSKGIFNCSFHDLLKTFARDYTIIKSNIKLLIEISYMNSCY